MKIEGIKERIEDLNIEENNYSSFVLANYDEKEGKLQEVLPIENKVINLEIDKSIFVLTDKEGNVLIPKEERGKYQITYIDKDTIIITKETGFKKMLGAAYYPIEVEKFKYDPNKKELVSKKKIHKEYNGMLSKVYCLNHKYDTILIKKTKNDRRIARLFSVKKNEYITPEFEELDYTDCDTLFKFKDSIESTEKIDNVGLSNSIVGFVDIKGNIYDEIYDERKNMVRKFDLNAHNSLMQYNNLKNKLRKELDDEINQKIENRNRSHTLIKELERKASKNK